MNPREHLSRSRRECPDCSGLSHCQTHRKARRVLSRSGADAYRKFAAENERTEREAIAESLIGDATFGAESMLPEGSK
ncbi:hypothetical protein [Halostagnicola sp. A-GB9-2]|uniref:hypothetical protein n=1 Tax=Halostagnicola sp. A-GB9-2 TaxID=3048066 RepID=UPI0024BF11BE|nr:hypothetical protein [Halostagnicola sp. A-GB9-2]MDJ1433591.1 hypothetical protein [Halostagnicola sp. A-GB9-2]